VIALSRLRSDDLDRLRERRSGERDLRRWFEREEGLVREEWVWLSSVSEEW
jgi:hypothetical protein